jgi:broad specificity phosphatase PhoE
VVSHGAIGRCLIGYLTGMTMRELVEIRMHQGRFCRIADSKAEWFDGAPLPP